MPSQRLELFRDVLDHELVDVNGVRCGMVDALEFTRSSQGLSLTALLAGPGAWAPRLPALLHWLALKTMGTHTVRVPWSEVAEVGEVIRLKSSAGALGLGRDDRKVNAWLRRIPGAS